MGVPSFWYSAAHIKKVLGINEVAINCGHAPQTVVDACYDQDLQKKFPIKFHLSDESSQILGSSGALWKLKDWIASDTLLVMNGDTICLPDLNKMLAQHKSTGCKMTIHVREFDVGNSGENYTHIKTHENKVVDLVFNQKKGLMFTGTYILDSGMVAKIPSGISDLKTTIMNPLIKSGELATYREDIPWFDTGSVRSFFDTQFEIADKIPSAVEIIGCKMKEIVRGVWVPLDWNDASIKYNFPVVMAGSESDWKKISMTYGPRFLGLHPNDEMTATHDVIVSKLSVIKL